MKCWVEIQLCAACVVNTVVLKWLINWKYWRFLGRKRLSLGLDGRFLNNFQSQRDCLDNKRIGREKERIKSETNQGRQAHPLQLIRQWIVNSNTPISKQKRERDKAVLRRCIQLLWMAANEMETHFERPSMWGWPKKKFHFVRLFPSGWAEKETFDCYPILSIHLTIRPK